ncbi:MAG TPA: cation:proton antiporter, partial [Gemmatimonadales bacterium]|nr:cation:proton antiporter [Gemmatimonadales bacterium]
AEQVHGSGVIATVVAGMVCGNYGARTGMTPTTRVAVETFWEYVAFALNSIVFLLIGFEVHLSAMLDSWQLILSAFVAVVAGRTAVVYVVTAVTARRANRIPGTWQAVLSWGGLRGGLSMVLALSLGAGFPNRDLLIATTFGVVVLSILVQGLSMGWVLHRLGLAQSRGERTAYDLGRGELRATQAALTELEEMMRTGQADRQGLETLRIEYQQRLDQGQVELQRLRLERGELHEEDLRRVRRHLLMVEKAEALESSRQGLLSREAYERLLTQVNDQLLKLDQPSGQ